MMLLVLAIHWTKLLWHNWMVPYSQITTTYMTRSSVLILCTLSWKKLVLDHLTIYISNSPLVPMSRKYEIKNWEWSTQESLNFSSCVPSAMIFLMTVWIPKTKPKVSLLKKHIAFLLWNPISGKVIYSDTFFTKLIILVICGNLYHSLCDGIGSMFWFGPILVLNI